MAGAQEPGLGERCVVAAAVERWLGDECGLEDLRDLARDRLTQVCPDRDGGRLPAEGCGLRVLITASVLVEVGDCFEDGGHVCSYLDQLASFEFFLR
jgi:hypothetical protein